MKTFWKEFFKKLWAILVRAFCCCAPYLYYIRTGKKADEQAESEQSDEKQPAPEKTKTE